jgi:hypothetical protein
MIPNAYGKYLADILEPIPYTEYDWLIGWDEVHLVEDNEMSGGFLFEEERVIDGQRLYDKAISHRYYLVFLTLSAFSKSGDIGKIENYKGFIESDCEILITLYDCSYVFIWCKDNSTLSRIHDSAISNGFEDIKYICEDDLIAEKYRLS